MVFQLEAMAFKSAASAGENRSLRAFAAFSEELRELDRNTVQLMIDEMRAEIATENISQYLHIIWRFICRYWLIICI